MKPDPKRIRELFVATVGKVDPQRWEPFLEDECGGDHELLGEVRLLLEAHREAGSFLNSPVVARAITGESRTSAENETRSAETAAIQAPGTVIGCYKLLQPIGEGGMGTVYMAEQTEPVRRTVALKLIKAGMDSRQVLARFGAERQALALMDHPNIAKVFEAGTTDAGRPYFVMELVKGIPITRFCDEQRLTTRERLELAIPVCQAVQHAHQKGIIHRDLKPSNVLIALYDDKPVPKVIDFGVAKATGQRLTDQTLYTEFGAVVGTLEYMSPEQAQLNQLDIDTRSDIYSLGVLLYELLTGSTPLERKRIKQAAFLELLRVIREEESPRPSTRLSTIEELPAIAACRNIEPRKLSGLMRGELDWIVMKALEKDRNRRYETANGLAADLRRYLDDEQVQACPPSARYRFGKFARRNRAALMTAGLVSVALVVGTFVSAWQAIRATRAEGVADERLGTANANYRAAEAQRQRAEASETKAKSKEQLAQDARKAAVESLKEALAAVDLMLTRVGQERLDNVPQMEPVRRELLQDALTFYQRFLQKNRDDPSIRRETARAYQRLGEIQRNLGQYAESEQNYRIAFAMFEAQQAQAPLEASVRYELSGAHVNFAMCLGELGKRKEQEQHIRQATVIAEDLTKEFPQDPKYRDLLVQAALWQATLIFTTQPAEAEKILRRNLTLTNNPWHLTDNYRVLGQFLANHGRSSEAEQALRKSVAACEQFAAEHPSWNWIQGNRGSILHELADVVAAAGRLQEAEEISARAILILDKLAAEFPEGPDFRDHQATAYQKRAVLLRKLNRTADAEQAYRRALDVFAKLAVDFPTLRGFPQTAFDQRLNLGQFLTEAGRPADALDVYHEAIDVPGKLAGNGSTNLNHWQGLVRTHIELARLLAKSGKTQEAETAYHRAAEIQQKLEKDFAGKPDERADLARSHFQAAELFRGAGRPADDEKFTRLAVSNLEKLTADFPGRPDYRYELAVRINWLGGPLDVLGRKSEAEACNVKTAAILEQLVAEHPAVPTYRHFQAFNFLCLADHQTRTGRFPEAERSHRAAIDLRAKLAAEFPDLRDYRHDLGHNHNLLGVFLGSLGRHEEAEQAHRIALGLYEKLVREVDPATGRWHRQELAWTYMNLGNLLHKCQRMADAEKAFREAIAVRVKLHTEFPDQGYAGSLASSYTGLALVLSATGQSREADKAYRKVLELKPENAQAMNNLAWLLATCEEPKFRNPTRAVELIRKAVELAPKERTHWNTLGVAQYRAGDWKAAVDALEKSMALSEGGDSFDWFFLAMARWQLGNKVEARNSFGKAVQWMDKSKSADGELVRFRAEAASLMGVNEKQK